MKILYWVAGVPTDEQKAEAKALGALLRNAQAFGPGDYVERCDEVAGHNIPEAYLKLYPVHRDEPKEPPTRPKKKASSVSR